MNFLSGLVSSRSLGNSNPEELVAAVCRSAIALEAAAKAGRANEARIVLADGVSKDVKQQIKEMRLAIDKQLGEIRLLLLGDAEKESDEATADGIAEAAIEHDLARCLAACMIDLPLESCKSAAHIFSNLMRRNGTAEKFAEHVVRDGFTLEALCSAYPENAEVALACGTMLREAAKHQIVTVALLKSPNFWLFMTDYCLLKNFDVASDAFEVLKTLLTRHTTLSATFIAENYDFFFECYNRLLHSETNNYVTCRESLRLLGELLLDRTNYATMMRYISSRDNLKILMLLLRSKKTRIQVEAFHVFKIFVANPRKPPDVARVLFNNRDKLVTYLRTFQNDKNDEQFLEEKQLIIDTLVNLNEPQSDPSANDATRANPRG